MHLKQLRSLAASGCISRREFMQLAIAAGMTLPAAAKMYSTAAKAGAKKWVFKLRSGLTFHNGKTIAADDVVATYNYHRADSGEIASNYDFDGGKIFERWWMA